MLDFKFDTSVLERKLHGVRAAVERDIVAATASAAREGAARAKDGRFKDVTGNLRASIRSAPIGWTGNTYWEKFESPTAYSVYVEYPTKPHWIYPKAGYNAPVGSLMPGQTRRGRGKGPHEHVVGRGHALRWVDGSGEHFAKRVWHPGTAGTSFMFYASLHARVRLITELHNGFANVRSFWDR